jgi:CrcB protein
MQSVNVSWQQWACVAVGGMLGALARFGVSLVLPSERFPWATTFVNLTGALLFGLLWGCFEVNGASKVWYLVALSGFMGAYTTFSTWVFEITSHAEQGRWSVSLAHLLGHVVLGLVVIWCGLNLGRAIKLGAS